VPCKAGHVSVAKRATHGSVLVQSTCPGTRHAPTQVSARIACTSLGAGTPLGDPIEVGALGQALADRSADGAAARVLAMYSAKSSYGHTEGAAGVTGKTAKHTC